METVSHHILPQMLVSPLWVDLNNLLKDYLKFMDDHFRESADLTFLAYRHRNYSKVCAYFLFCLFSFILMYVTANMLLGSKIFLKAVCFHFIPCSLLNS